MTDLSSEESGAPNDKLDVAGNIAQLEGLLQKSIDFSTGMMESSIDADMAIKVNNMAGQKMQSVQ